MGEINGIFVGTVVGGMSVGSSVGFGVGSGFGSRVGSGLGSGVGSSVGRAVGFLVGAGVGLGVGAEVSTFSVYSLVEPATVRSTIKVASFSEISVMTVLKLEPNVAVLPMSINEKTCTCGRTARRFSSKIPKISCGLGLVRQSSDCNPLGNF